MADKTVEFILQVKTTEAQRAIAAVNTEAGKLNATAKTAQATTKGLQDSLAGAAQGAGRAKESMEGLATALSVVNPELGNAVRMAGAMVGGLKGIATTGASLASVLGPVAVAVGALGLAYRKLSSDLDEANARMEKQAKLAKEAQDRASERKKTIQEIELEAAVAQGRAPQSDLDALRARSQAESVFAPDLEAAAEKQRGLQAQLADLLAQESRLSDAIQSQRDRGFQGYSEEAERLTVVQSSIASVKDQLEVGKQIAKGIEERARDLGRTIFEGMQAEADKPKPKNPEKTPKQVDMGAWDNGNLFDAEMFAGISGTGTFKIPQGIGFTGSAYGTSAEVLSAALNQPVDLGPAEVVRPTLPPGMIQGVSGLLQGDAMSMLGMLPGAIGGPVGMAVGALSNIGRMGAGGVRGQLEGFTESIIAGLEALPEILAEVIPDFVEGLITDLIPALVETFPLLAKAIALDLPVALAKAIVDALASVIPGGDADTGFLGKTANTLLDVGTLGITLATDTGVGRRSRANGGIIDRTGAYMLHQGETVIPATGAGSQTAMRGAGAMGGGGVVINVQGNAIGSMDRFVRDLEAHIGFGGPGNAQLLGGR